MKYERVLRNIINKAIEIPDDTSISNTDNLENYGLDSINYIILIVMIEDELNIRFPEDKINFLNFRSLLDIHHIIEETVNEQ